MAAFCMPWSRARKPRPGSSITIQRGIAATSDSEFAAYPSCNSERRRPGTPPLAFGLIDLDASAYLVAAACSLAAGSTTGADDFVEVGRAIQSMRK